MRRPFRPPPKSDRDLDRDKTYSAYQPMPTYIETAKQFGDLIAKSAYTTAHTLLTEEAQAAHMPNDFKEAVEGMTTYAQDRFWKFR
jgi:hypothetical protein